MTQPIAEPTVSERTPIPGEPPIPVPPRLASKPVVGATKTTLGAAALAAVLIGGLGIANPVLAAAAMAAGTGALSYIGMKCRDYLNDPNPDPGALGVVKGFLAHTFSWLG